MAVDLTDLVEPVKRQVSAPGEIATLFPSATDADWKARLVDAFWEAYLDGLLQGYIADPTSFEVTPTSGSTDLSLDQQQIIVVYAGYIALRNKLFTTSTSFRAKAGPNEFEEQKSATLLKALLEDLKRRRDYLLARLSDDGLASTYVIDAVIARTTAIEESVAVWLAGSE